MKVVDKLKRFKWKSKIPVNPSWSLLCTYFWKTVFISCVSSVVVWNTPDLILSSFSWRKVQNVSYKRKLINKTASFVLSIYVNDINDIVKTGWLPARQRRDFHVLKLVHQALHSLSWPSYVPLDTIKHLRSLRSRAAIRLIIPMERGTFQDSAAKLFNALLANIRNYRDFKVYCREVNAYILIK